MKGLARLLDTYQGCPRWAGTATPARPMRFIRTAVVVAAGATLLAGCGRGGDDETAKLRSEVAALRQQVGSTTTAAPETTTSTTASAPSTTTTAAPITTTTSRPTTTTTKAPATTTSTTRPTPQCSVLAVASPARAHTSQTLAISSNMKSTSARVTVRYPAPPYDTSKSFSVLTDASGSARLTFNVDRANSAPVEVKVRFDVPGRALADPPQPDCMTLFQAVA